MTTPTAFRYDFATRIAELDADGLSPELTALLDQRIEQFYRSLRAIAYAHQTGASLDSPRACVVCALRDEPETAIAILRRAEELGQYGLPSLQSALLGLLGDGTAVMGSGFLVQRAG